MGCCVWRLSPPPLSLSLPTRQSATNHRRCVCRNVLTAAPFRLPVSPHEFTHTCHSAHGPQLRCSPPLVAWWWSSGSRTSGGAVLDPAQMFLLLMMMMIEKIPRTHAPMLLCKLQILAGKGGEALLLLKLGEDNPHLARRQRAASLSTSLPPYTPSLFPSQPITTGSQATPPLLRVHSTAIPRTLY